MNADGLRIKLSSWFGRSLCYAVYYRRNVRACAGSKRVQGDKLIVEMDMFSSHSTSLNSVVRSQKDW